jgi:uncharacterized C2H2 Zn-finger protein
MRADEVPDDGLLPRTMDVNEPFTLRREEAQTFAGENLEEEISATILRRAKENFWKRDLQARAEDDQVLPSVEQGDADATATEGETNASDTAATSAVDNETEAEAEAEADAPCRRPRKRRRRGASPTFAPVFSADDDRSYMLLRPAARQIMEKLDDTLMILHNQRAAGLGNISESSASDEGETEPEEMSIRSSVSPEKSPAPPRYRGGRPRKVNVPLEGETEQEMLVRLAKENHRKNPFLTDMPGSGEEQRGRSKSRSKSLSIGRQSSLPSLAESRASSQRSSWSRRSGSRSSSTSSTNREKLLGRWGLRDWRDVLGAAALAGFSPSAIARAAQRCSTLFREEMTIHTLHERSAADSQGELETVRYVPGAALPPSSDEDRDESEVELAQTRTISRYSSVRLPQEVLPEPKPQAPRGGRSRTPAAGLLCPHPGCPRATQPFKKRWNRDRHIQTVHHGQEPGSPELEPQTEHRDRSATPAALVCSYPGCLRATHAFKTRTALVKHIQTVHESQTSRPRGFIKLTPTELEKTLRDLDRSGAHGFRSCPVPGCPGASKVFTRWAKVVRHIREVHGERRVAGDTEPELTDPEDISGQRGRSATPAPATLLCPIPGCPRATRAFGKRSNLARHIREVHEGQAADYSTEPELTEPETASKQPSRSTTPGAVYFCHFSSCPRSVDGIKKVTNFRRHMQTVHGITVNTVTLEEEDSMDEMHDGAHLDGFLKPIKFRRGWRTVDTQLGRHRSR